MVGKKSAMVPGLAPFGVFLLREKFGLPVEFEFFTEMGS